MVSQTDIVIGEKEIFADAYLPYNNQVIETDCT